MTQDKQPTDERVAKVQEAMRAAGHPSLAETLPGRFPHYDERTQAAIIRNWLGDAGMEP